MALIDCPECAKKISDKAKECVHCGFPLNSNEIQGVPVLLKLSDIAQIMRCGKNKAYKIITSKSFPTIKIGKEYYIPVDKFKEWIDDYSHKEFYI